jgi:Xaa-Pro aminopeptidase
LSEPASPAAAAPARRVALDRGLDGLGCAALAVVASSGRDPDLAPWVGGADVGRSVLVLPRGAPPRLAYPTPMERAEAAATGLALVTPEALGLPELARSGAGEAEELAVKLRGALGAAGVVPGRVAVTGFAPAGVAHAACRALEAEGWTFVPGGGLARWLRKTKTAAELGGIRRAAAGAVAAFRRVAGCLAAAVPEDGSGRGGARLILGGEPLTARRLRAEAAAELAMRGLGLPEGSIVAAGVDGSVPHSRGEDARVVRAGESLIVDLFPRGALWADCTRTLCYGLPQPALAAAHEAVCAAQAAAAASAASGVRAWDLQLVACGVFEERGYATPVSVPDTTHGYVHNLGHGVGYELHELPSFRKESGAEGVLGVGDVLTLEPGLYEPGEGWGVRVEDLFWLGEAGLERLTELPRELDPRRY